MNIEESPINGSTDQLYVYDRYHTEKKKFVLIFKEIQTGAVAKSYLTYGLLKYD
jgi:hypothetical protein